MTKEEKVSTVLGLKMQDAALLCERAETLGLDPLTGQIHLLHRKSYDQATRTWKENVSFQVGIEGFRLIAERSGKYDGQDPIIFVVLRNGKEVRTDVVLEGDVPVAAIASVYKKGISRPFTAVAHYKDYVGKKSDGSLTAMWQKMTIMLPKCAEAAAFRKGFPDLNLGGAYEPAELVNGSDDCDKSVVAAPDACNPPDLYAPAVAVLPEPADTTGSIPESQETVDVVVGQTTDTPEGTCVPADDGKKELATDTQKNAILRLAKAKGLNFDPVALGDLSKSAAAEMIKKFNNMKKAA